jgi:hypothetical protein
MNTAAECRQHAEGCRQTARSLKSEEHRLCLNSIADTWEDLARDSDREEARGTRPLGGRTLR